MEATYSSETSVDFERTIEYYIPDDRTLHTHRLRTSNPIYMQAVSNTAEVVLFVSFVRTCACPVVCVNEGQSAERVAFC
jgi:hypothetical protein